MRVSYLLALLMVFAFNGQAVTSTGGSVDSGKVILVLDASGSMWGRIDGRTKVEIAREAVAHLVASWDPDIELGLIAYGHREVGKCSDIELVLPVAQHDPKNFINIVNGLKAKGKTPLSAAVKQAAELLTHTNERATVVLVSDGIENCGLDPCAVAEELEQQGVAFTAHVIGFDLENKELEALKCIAEGTGGLFFQAVDAASLTEALSVVEEEVASVPEAVKVPPSSSLAAVLTSGLPPLQDQEINWSVTSSQKNNDGSSELVETYRNTTPRLRLATGLYRVQVQTGLATSETTIQVDADNPADHIVDLNAGRIKLVGYNKEGGEQFTDNVRWYINAADGQGYKNLDYTNYASPRFTLPAGTYQIVLQSGLAEAKVETEIEPGDDRVQEVYLNAGQVKLQAVLLEGMKPLEKRVRWYLTRSEPNSKGEYEILGHNSHYSPTFTIGSGIQRFVVETGSVKRAFTVDIETDKLIEKQVSLDAGQATMIAVSKSSGKRVEKVRWTITSASSDAKGRFEKIAYSSYHSPTFVLQEGKFRVVIDHGGKSLTAEIDVRAGEQKEIRVGID